MGLFGGGGTHRGRGTEKAGGKKFKKEAVVRTTKGGKAKSETYVQKSKKPTTASSFDGRQRLTKTELKAAQRRDRQGKGK